MLKVFREDHHLILLWYENLNLIFKLSDNFESKKSRGGCFNCQSSRKMDSIDRTDLMANLYVSQKKISGYLFKKIKGNGWKKGFYLLKDRLLYCFANRADAVPLGMKYNLLMDRCDIPWWMLY